MFHRGNTFDLYPFDTPYSLLSVAGMAVVYTCILWISLFCIYTGQQTGDGMLTGLGMVFATLLLVVLAILASEVRAERIACARNGQQRRQAERDAAYYRAKHLRKP